MTALYDSPPASAVDVTWAHVEDGFHVGSRAGEFVGYIDRQADGRFRAFSAFAQPVGDFDVLPDAMRALVSSADGAAS